MIDKTNQEPVAWSVTWDGIHAGNFYFREVDAKEHKARFDKKYPHEKREIVPLYELKQNTRPSLPDAITDNSESPEFRSGWNECREVMAGMMK